MHITATTLATYFSRDQCARYLYLEGSKKLRIKNENIENSEKRKENISSLTQANFDKGIKWEEDICEYLKSKNQIIVAPENESIKGKIRIF